MGHPCIGFGMERAEDAYEHFDLEIIEDYGDKCERHYLHTWDDGCRSLMRCRACGGYVLLQRSEFHSFSGHDSYYKDFFPVSGPNEAKELNGKFNGFEIEEKFPGRYIKQDNLAAPQWSRG